MILMTVTDFARNMEETLNQLEYQGEAVLLIRNKKPLVKLIPQNKGTTALEAMSDLYRTLPEAAAETWLLDSRQYDAMTDIGDQWAT